MAVTVCGFHLLSGLGFRLSSAILGDRDGLGKRFLARFFAGSAVEAPEPAAPQGETCEEMLERLTGVDPRLCPKCGRGRLKHCQEYPRPRLPIPSQRAPP